MKRALQLGAGLLVAGALLWVFLRGVEPQAVAAALRAARPGWLAACLGLTLLHYLVRAWRWRLLLTPVRKRVPLRPLVETILAGYSVTFLIPGRLGEVVRPALLARRQRLPLPATLTTVGLDRILDAAALAVFLVIFLLLTPAEGPGSLPEEYAGRMRLFGWAGGLVVAVGLPLLWLAARLRHRLPRPGADWKGRLLRLLRSGLDGLGALQGPRPLLGAVAGSLAIWLVLAGQAWAGIRAFGIDLPFAASLGLIGALAVGIAVPTPAGAGGFHAAGAGFLEWVYQVPQGQAVACIIVLHLISVVPALLLGGWVLAREGVSLGELFSRRQAGGPGVVESRS